MSRYFPAFGSQIGRSSKGYANAGSGGVSGVRGTGTGGQSALESGRGVGGRVRSGSKAVDDSSVSLNGSEVELAQTGSDGLKSNPFEVHVVHEWKVGVERGNTASPREFGVKGEIFPAHNQMATAKRHTPNSSV